MEQTLVHRGGKVPVLLIGSTEACSANDSIRGMPDESPERADTIEWGDAQPERQGWLGRLTVTPRATGDEVRREEPAQRLNYVALGLIIVGFLAVLAAQYLPWVHIDLSSLNDGTTPPPTTGTRTYDFALGVINTWQIMAYGLSVMLLLAALAYLLVAGPATRRPAAATALGLVAGQLTLLVGMARSLQQGAGLGSPTQVTVLPDKAVTLGFGYSTAVLAVILFLAAALLAARAPRLRRTQEATATTTDDAGPADLVVTPLPVDDQRWSARDIQSNSPPTDG
jgi:hypothetical protein